MPYHYLIIIAWDRTQNSPLFHQKAIVVELRKLCYNCYAIYPKILLTNEKDTEVFDA